MKDSTFNAVMDKAVKIQAAVYEDYNNELISLDEVRAMITRIDGMYECLKFIVELEGVEK